MKEIAMNKQLLLCPTLLLGTMLVAPMCAFGQAAAPAAEPAAPAPAAQPAHAAAPAQPAAPAAAAAQDSTPGFFAEEKHTSNSEVIAVDPATRLITLKEPNEEPQTYALGEEVRNLDQVKAGDRVKVTYYEASSLRVLPPGEVVNDDVATVQRSAPGEKPAGIAARKKTMTTTVASVFPGSREVVTRDSKERLTTWKIREGKNMDEIHSGDRVQLTFTSALAISVSAAPPTTAPATPAAATTPPTPAAPADSAAPAAPAAPADNAAPATPAK